MYRENYIYISLKAKFIRTV